MRGVQFRKRLTDVQITLSPEDWQLYSSLGGCRDAANEINEALTKALSVHGATRVSVISAVSPVMGKWAKWGACDTEPQGVLSDVLDATLGEYGRED